MKKALVLAVVLASGMPAFAFETGMGARDVGSEVSARYKKGETLLTIATAAKTVNVGASVLAPELLLTGNTAGVVLAAMIKAGYYASDAVNALVNQGGDRAALNQVAIDNGADPTTLLAATAAGGNPPATGLGGNGSNLNGRTFGQTRAATVGGGGSSSVSPS